MYKVLTSSGLKYTDGQSIKNRTNFKGWHCKQTNYIIDAAWWEVGTSVCRTPYPVSIDDYTGPKEIICPNDNCFCGTDIAMPKGKTEDHLLMIPYLQVSDKLGPNEEILAIDGEEGVVVDYYTDRKCNFSCSYCDPRSHNYKGEWMTLDKMKEAWNKVNPTNVKKINISGGESTLIPHYIEFVKWLREKEPKAMIWTLTNGTKQVPYLHELNKISCINFSIHFEFINERYIDKLKRFCDTHEGLPCKIKVMFLPKYEHMVKKFIELFYKKYKKIHLKITPLWDKSNNMNLLDYNSEQFKMIYEVQ